MAARLNNFLKKNNILYKYQFGFRKNYSTVLAVIDVVEDILEHLDQRTVGYVSRLAVIFVQSMGTQ